MAKTAVARFLKEYPEALNNGVGAIFVGAGVSMAAGYPSWASLLGEIGEELGVGSGDLHDLAALAQWSIQESGGETRVRNVIKAEIGQDYPVPDVLETIARLPVRQIWTTNYDRLIERAFRAIYRPIDVISGVKDLAAKATPGATRLYKMHGSVDRLDDIVIATDHYELFRSKRGAYLNLLQAHLTSQSMLFIGLSLTDPNIKHVLALIRESFTEAPPEHFAIVRPPKRDDFKTDDEFNARTAQHRLWAKDLRRYGLVAVEIDDYDEVPELLRKVERRVAARRVWVSGSWPIESGGNQTAAIHLLAEHIGRWIAQSGLDLVTGGGLIVGSASLSGFLQALGPSGAWDLDRRLIARPFPQPLAGKLPDRVQWTALRRELARQAGVVIFLGGAKLDGSDLIAAGGVLEEFEIAQQAGAFLLPVGATGGAAKVIADRLIGSPLVATGSQAVRPSDDELQRLCVANANPAAVVAEITQILKRTAASH